MHKEQDYKERKGKNLPLFKQNLKNKIILMDIMVKFFHKRKSRLVYYQILMYKQSNRFQHVFNLN